MAWPDKAVELVDRFREGVAGKSGRIEPSCAVRRGLRRQFKKPDLKRIARTETAGKRGLEWGGTTGSKLLQPSRLAWQQVTDRSS